jgi:hypothetical protein
MGVWAIDSLAESQQESKVLNSSALHIRKLKLYFTGWLPLDNGLRISLANHLKRTTILT